MTESGHPLAQVAPPQGRAPEAIGSAFVAQIDAYARSRPEAPALIYEDAITSFGDLATRSNSVAAALLKLGVRKGDRVALWLENVPAWVEIACACARIGAVAVATNTRFRAIELADILHRSRAKVLVYWPNFTEARHNDVLTEILREDLVHLETVVAYGGLSALPPSLMGKRAVDYSEMLAPAPAVTVPAAPRDPWLLFTTSGTTRKPKFVVHCHAGVAGHARDLAEALRYGHGTVVAAPHPLSGVLAFSCATAALMSGCPVLLTLRFDGAEVGRQMIRHRVTNFCTIEQGLSQLLEKMEGSPLLPDFRFAIFGAISGDTEGWVRKTDERRMRIVGCFGMTEIHAAFTVQRIDGSAAERAPAGGFPICREARFRIIDRETRKEAQEGAPGEFEVFSPHMFTHYFEDPEATRAAFTDDGFLRTGDIGRRMPDGSFRFIARSDDALRLNGFLVSPLEISSCLETHPSVGRCEVVAATTSLGVKPVAFVIPAAGFDINEEELGRHCRNRLASYKTPIRFIGLDDFPQTIGPNGPKVQRAQLRAMAAALGLS